MAIEVRIKKKLGNFQLDIDFKTDENRIGILGASGCGKSMTLKCIAGIETPDEGRIIVDGTLLYDSAKKISLKPQKRHIGYLFQNYALFPTMTVEENILTGLKSKRMQKVLSTAAAKSRVQEMVERFGLKGLEKRYPAQLSGGQKQRVAIARALASRPSIILADEPTGNLDSRTELEVIALLKTCVTKYGQTLVMITHDETIAQMADEIIVIEDGKVVTAE